MGQTPSLDIGPMWPQSAIADAADVRRESEGGFKDFVHLSFGVGIGTSIRQADIPCLPVHHFRVPKEFVITSIREECRSKVKKYWESSRKRLVAVPRAVTTMTVLKSPRLVGLLMEHLYRIILEGIEIVLLALFQFFLVA